MKQNHSLIRRAALLLIALMLIGVFASCRSSGTPNETDPATGDATVTDDMTSAPTDALTDGSTDRSTDGSADGDTGGTTEEITTPDTHAPTGEDTDLPTETEEPETVPPEVTVPDPSTITLMIEDFNSMTDITDIKAGMDPLDLSFFGIEPATNRIDDEYAQEGRAFVSILTAAAWCQTYQIRGERLNVFDQATDHGNLYLRMYVCTPDNVSIALTLGLGAGRQLSFLDPTKAIVTPKNGAPLTCATANATSDAGENSSISIPAGFEGYIAYPINALKQWAANDPVSDRTAIDYFKIDVRPSGMSYDDRYILDAICLSDSPVAETVTGGAGSQKPTFTTKNEELEYMFEQVLKQKDVTFEYCPEFDPKGYPNIKAIWIQGPKMGNRDTKFFAFIGFPKGASKESPVPAVVLNHGGGGYAYASWVDIWNQKGYAAIAIGNTGYAPTLPGMSDFYSNSSWTHTLTDEMIAADPRILPPDNDGMYSSMGPIDRMWMYHAVSQTILANTLLRNDERVMTDKVGTTGISWGGVITSIAIGYDNRFAFAIPVYGSGYLHESLSWMKQHFNADGTKELWDASLRLKNVKMPVLWLAWTNDTCFSINTNSKSYEDTENGVLTLLMNMGHGHLEGWNPAEIYRFADSVVKDGEGLTVCKTQPSGTGKISFEIDIPSDASRIVARVQYLTEKMTYSADSHIEQTWKSTTGSVSGSTVTVTVPEDAWSYYVELTTVVNGQKYVTCSKYVIVRD